MRFCGFEPHPAELRVYYLLTLREYLMSSRDTYLWGIGFQILVCRLRARQVIYLLHYRSGPWLTL